MMFGAKAYAQVGLESGVNSASPHQLITMLFDGAIEAIKRAKNCLANQDTIGKITAIDKAIRIVGDGLISSLDLEAGDELGAQLLSLYQFVSRELVLANAKNDVAKMDNCIELLADLRSAWAEIGQKLSQPS